MYINSNIKSSIIEAKSNVIFNGIRFDIFACDIFTCSNKVTNERF